MSSSFPSLMSSLTQQEWSLGLRAASLFVLVVLFQVVMARGVHSLQKETNRRLQHALTGHALVQISYVLPRSVAAVLLFVAAAGMFLLQHYVPDHFRQAFGPLLRPDELSGKALPGAFYFLVGTAMTVVLVDDWTIVRYAVECLALADPVASWIGSSIRSPALNQGSSVSGCLACFATAWMVGWLMLEDATPILLTVGAVVCTVAEALPYGNDNLTIPIATSMTVYHLAR
jgi:dolichol kinase